MPIRRANFRRVLAVNLKRRRKERGLTHEELAEKADLHVNIISLLERSKTNPKLDTLARLAKALGCLPHDLLKPE